MTHQKDDMDTEELAASLYEHIKHGDDEHRAWLRRESAAWVNAHAAALASKPDAAPAGGAVEALRIEVRQADERGDEAMRRAHAAEGAVEALRELVAIIDKAGLLNLSNGVELGPTVWYVKASDCMDAARAALAAAPVVPPQPDSMGASPSVGPGSTASRPEPQSVSALRAPIPGARFIDQTSETVRHEDVMEAPAVPDCAFSLALNVKHPGCHNAADAFWEHWKKYGETHKHGYYESTWGAINRAIRMVGVVPHDYGQPPTKD